MPIQPIRRDDNGIPLPDRGTETVTKRFSGIDTGGQAISFDIDVKEALVHVEGSTVVAKLTGTHSSSQEIVWTSDGTTLPPLHLVRDPGETVLTISAPSGTISVSVIAWR